MIKGVRANQPTFQDVKFFPHFNLVLAERTAASTDRDSRNGLGKSLLIEILHFCLGARGSRGKGVVVDALSDWSFRTDLEVNGTEMSFSRSVADDDRRWVYVESAFDNWPVQPKVHEGRARLSVPEQNKLLGRVFFGLSESIESVAFGPSYRSLISYLIRRPPDGFLDPFTHDRNQQEWDKKVNVTYHLSLDWRDASSFQELRAQKKVIDQLDKAVKEGGLPSYLGSEGALEAERVRLERDIQRRVDRLAAFEVREDYKDIEVEASRLAERAHALVNANIRDRRFLELYAERINDEVGQRITGPELERLYQEAEMALPDLVKRRLTEVKAFHESVVENRRAYLLGEIERLRSDIDQRDVEVRSLDERRAEVMRVLEASGALEEYTRLQEMLVEIRGRLYDVRSRLERLKEVTEAKAQWQIANTELLRITRTRFEELQAERDRAITYFNANTEALYEVPGRLIVDVTDRGVSIGIDIERADSHGVSNMKIFCFDLMLMQVWADRGNGPGILIHDSALFDGVDERQIAAALTLAQVESERLGFQYICGLNSDDLPRVELGETSPVLDGICLELHDQDASGRLLGIQF